MRKREGGRRKVEREREEGGKREGRRWKGKGKEGRREGKGRRWEKMTGNNLLLNQQRLLLLRIQNSMLGYQNMFSNINQQL